MKKHFTHFYAPFLVLTLVFLVSVFLFPQHTLAVPCTAPGVPAGCTPADLTDPGTTNPIKDPGTTNPIGSGGGLVKLDNPFKGGNSLFELLKSVMNDIVLPIGGVLAVLAFIYSGFLYVTAQGDETQLKTAHKALLYTSIGTAVLLGSWVLANVICETIGQLGGPACVS